MADRRPRLKDLYDRLLAHYGPQHWWPGQTPFEVMVGAILTQNTNWSNVEKAIARLQARGLLQPEAIYRLPVTELAELIRPAGYFNVKARRLKHFVAWFMKRFGGDVEAMAAADAEALREELLGVRGIGRETADSILLYALDKLTFVVDTYTYRVLTRHGLIDEQAGYDEIKEFCEDHLPADLHVYNECHALLVRVGKEFCKPTPRCDPCPLREFL